MHAGRSNQPKIHGVNPIFLWLTPADMDRLPHLINTEKKFSVVNNLVRQLGLHLSRACLVYKGNRPFLLMHYPSSLEDYSDFYGVGWKTSLAFIFQKSALQVESRTEGLVFLRQKLHHAVRAALQILKIRADTVLNIHTI
jgi:hypothetical protein